MKFDENFMHSYILKALHAEIDYHCKLYTSSDLHWSGMHLHEPSIHACMPIFYMCFEISSRSDLIMLHAVSNVLIVIILISWHAYCNNNYYYCVMFMFHLFRTVDINIYYPCSHKTKDYNMVSPAWFAYTLYIIATQLCYSYSNVDSND